mmetsp:Transcript_21602/g.45595  ORF Transcript_21602/g.45595 Transcript_21602/m.45595 type:complete len:215 (-) Transcript_21602:219-863(-)
MATFLCVLLLPNRRLDARRSMFGQSDAGIPPLLRSLLPHPENEDRSALRPARLRQSHQDFSSSSQDPSRSSCSRCTLVRSADTTAAFDRGVIGFRCTSRCLREVALPSVEASGSKPWAIRLSATQRFRIEARGAASTRPSSTMSPSSRLFPDSFRCWRDRVFDRARNRWFLPVSEILPCGEGRLFFRPRCCSSDFGEARMSPIASMARSLQYMS